MRLRLVIPAAIAAVATYAALVRDETPRSIHVPAAPQPNASLQPTPVMPAPASPTTVGTIERRPVGAASPVEVARPSAWDPTEPSVYDLLAGTPPTPPQTRGGPDMSATEVDRSGEVDVDPWAAAIPEADEHASANDDAQVAGIAAAQPDVGGQQISLDEGRFALGGWAASAGHTMVSAVTFRRRLMQDLAADRIVLEIDASDNVPEDGLVVLADPGFAPDRDGFTLLLASAEPGPFSAAGSYRVLPPA